MKNQSGRSMIEILGVLAIIALLSVIGVAAYRYAVSRHEANTILKQSHEIASDVMFRQQMFSAREDGDELIFQGSDKTEMRAFRVDSQVFRVVTPALDKDVCSAILQLGPDYPMLLPQTFEEENCAEATGFVANFYFSILGNRRYAGNNGGDDPDIPDPKDCTKPVLSDACEYLVNTGNVDADDCPIYQKGEHTPGDECTTETGKAGTYDSDCDCIPNDCEIPEDTDDCANYEKTGDFDENGCPEYSKSCEPSTSECTINGTTTKGVCSKETCECVETTEPDDGTKCPEPALSDACEYLVNKGNVDANDCPIYQIDKHTPGDECTTETGKVGTYDENCNCIPNGCPDDKPYLDEKGNCHECTKAKHCLPFCPDYDFPYYYDLELEIYTTMFEPALAEGAEATFDFEYKGAYLNTEGGIEYELPLADEDDPMSDVYSMDSLGVCHYTCVQHQCVDYTPACAWKEYKQKGTYGPGDPIRCFWETRLFLKQDDEDNKIWGKIWGYCPDNTTSDGNALSKDDCVDCEIWEYSSPERGIGECQLCPENSRRGDRTELNSMHSGTAADEYCVCSGAAVWNYTEEKCMPCPDNAVVSENPAYPIPGWNVCGCENSYSMITDADGNVTGCCPDGQYWNGSECVTLAGCPDGTTYYGLDDSVEDESIMTGDLFYVPNNVLMANIYCMCPATAPIASSYGIEDGDSSPCQACSGVYIYGSGCVTDYCDNFSSYTYDEETCEQWGELCNEETVYADTCYKKQDYCEHNTYPSDQQSCNQWAEECVEDGLGATYIGSVCVGTSDLCSYMSTYVTDEDSCSVWSDACNQPMYWSVGECVDASSICETADSMTTDYECASLNDYGCNVVWLGGLGECVDESSICETVNSITTDSDCAILNDYGCDVVWFEMEGFDEGHCYASSESPCSEAYRGNFAQDEASCLAWGPACGYSVSWEGECIVTGKASDDGSAV